MESPSSNSFAALKNRWKVNANKHGSPLPGRIRPKRNSVTDGKGVTREGSLARRRHSLAVRAVSNRDDSEELANVDIIDRASPGTRRNKSFRELRGVQSPVKGESIRQVLTRFDSSLADIAGNDEVEDLMILEELNEDSGLMQSSGNSLLHSEVSDFSPKEHKCSSSPLQSKNWRTSPSRSKKNDCRTVDISSHAAVPSLSPPNRRKATVSEKSARGSESPAYGGKLKQCQTNDVQGKRVNSRVDDDLSLAGSESNEGSNRSLVDETTFHTSASSINDLDFPATPYYTNLPSLGNMSPTCEGSNSMPSNRIKKVDELRSTDHVKLSKLLAKQEEKVDDLRATDHGTTRSSGKARSPKKKKKKTIGTKKKKDKAETKVSVTVTTITPPKPSPNSAPTRRPPTTQATSGRRKQACIYLQHGSPDKIDVPRFEHTEAEKDLILQALYNNESLTGCRAGHISQLVSAFEPCEYPAGEIIMEEGEDPDYMFVVDSGLVEITAEECHLKTGSARDSFGELSLLYDTRRATTVLALEDCRMFRIHKDAFRTILAADSRRCLQKRRRLLQGIRFFEHLSPSQVKEISDTMTPRLYSAGSTIVKKGDKLDAFYVVADGQVQRVVQPTILRSGAYFGEDSMVTGKPISSDYRVISDSMVFVFEKRLFAFDLAFAIFKLEEAQILARAPCLKDYDQKHLLNLLKEKEFSYGDNVYVEKDVGKAGLYIVRSGCFSLRSNGAKDTLGPGASFGEAVLQRALSKSKKSAKSTYSVTATEKSVCSVILAKDILDGSNAEASTPEVLDPVKPIVVPDKLSDLEKHSILGQGAFGQVWLVSDKKKVNSFALKIQSKSFIVEQNQVEAVIQEKVMLANLKHPFLITLHRTYQDKKSIYFLMDYVQGGELFSLLHDKDGTIPEAQAKFYAHSLADVLRYLHRGKYVYRDLKPENVMIDSTGYVKLIDFGFCKYLLEDKTYTLCGTPGYLSPESVLSEGHNHGADHWALGILIFEMLFGQSPFFYEDIDQSELFSSIVDDPLPIPEGTSREAKNILLRLCEKSTVLRLGAKKENEVIEHPWFRDSDLSSILSRKATAPWKPAVSGPLDTSNFQPDEDDQVDFPDRPLSQRDAKLFEGVF